MPTFRGLAFTLFALLLAGCLGPSGHVREAPSRVAVTHANLIVAGPPGFCVDLDASRNQDRSAFVLLASCAAITNQPLMPQPDLPVVLTAAVAEGSAPTPSVLEAYFQSSAGVAQLQEGGPVDSMRIRSGSEAVFIYTSGPRGDRWRGVIPLRPGFIVTVAMEGIGAIDIPEKVQLAALDQFADQILAANPAMLLTTSGL